MGRWNQARWQPLGRNFGGPLRPIAVCLHHQAGNGNPYQVYLSRGVSAHFWIPKSGQPVQHLDTSVQAWHGIAHNAYSIGVETEGCGAPPHAEKLTESQLKWFGELMKWANRTHGIPLQLSESVTQKGLNYHRARGGPATGCPCAVRVNQRAEILRRARGGTTAAKGPYRHVANGKESINDVAARRRTTVANLIEVGFGKGALNDTNKTRWAKYLAWPGRDKPMPQGLPYWTKNP